LSYDESADGGIAMASIAYKPLTSSVGDERFFMRAAVAMAVVILAGFSTQPPLGSVFI
jgi:hypothetical protein